MATPPTPSIACIGVIGKQVNTLSVLCPKENSLTPTGQSSPRSPVSTTHGQPISPAGLFLHSQFRPRHLRPARPRQEPRRPGPGSTARCRRAAECVGLGDGHGHQVCYRARHVGPRRCRGYWSGNQRGRAETGMFANQDAVDQTADAFRPFAPCRRRISSCYRIHSIRRMNMVRMRRCRASTAVLALRAASLPQRSSELGRFGSRVSRKSDCVDAEMQCCAAVAASGLAVSTLYSSSMYMTSRGETTRSI